MAKFILLFVIIFAVYVSAYPSQKNMIESLRIRRAAKPDPVPFFVDHHHHHDHHHDDFHYHPDDFHHHHHDDFYHHHHDYDDFHHHHDDHHVHIHDHHHHDDYHPHDYGYDDIHVYIDAPKTNSHNSQVIIDEAVLDSIDDDPIIHSIIKDVISGYQTKDRNIPTNINVQRAPEPVPVSDPDVSQFIRRK